MGNYILYRSQDNLDQLYYFHQGDEIWIDALTGQQIPRPNNTERLGPLPFGTGSRSRMVYARLANGWALLDEIDGGARLINSSSPLDINQVPISAITLFSGQSNLPIPTNLINRLNNGQTLIQNFPRLFQQPSQSNLFNHILGGSQNRVYVGTVPPSGIPQSTQPVGVVAPPSVVNVQDVQRQYDLDLIRKSYNVLLSQLYGIPVKLPQSITLSNGITAPFVNFVELTQQTINNPIVNYTLDPELQPWSGPPSQPNRIFTITTQDGSYFLIKATFSADGKTLQPPI